MLNHEWTLVAGLRLHIPLVEQFFPTLLRSSEQTVSIHWYAADGMSMFLNILTFPGLHRRNADTMGNDRNQARLSDTRRLNVVSSDTPSLPKVVQIQFGVRHAANVPTECEREDLQGTWDHGSVLPGPAGTASKNDITRL